VSLLNVAFAGAPAWWLLCPYDTETLDAAVIDEAHRSHPFVVQGRAQQVSTGYRGLELSAAAACGSPTSCATSSSSGRFQPAPSRACTCAALTSADAVGDLDDQTGG
jgi:hypothetical protein